MNIKGTLYKKFEIQEISDKFKKREFVLEVAENPKYPELIKLELVNDKCTLLDNTKIGTELDVHINLRGKEWTDSNGDVKYFNTIQAWKIDFMQQNSSQPVQDNVVGNKTDDLPF